MKQLKLLFVGLLLVAANGLFAQITFTEGTFEEALAKAKAEKKNLFIDFYANWCGPCKVMAAQVFTIPPVGDYFNEHFINCKLDCDAAANKEVVKRYKVESLPTLMFLDSKGEVLRTLVGAVTPDVLMLEAQIATGEELPFEKLYEKSRKEKKNTELQQKLLIRAPHFIGTQNRCKITLSDFTTRISCGFAVPARPTTGRPSDASAVTSGPFMPACRSAT